MAWWQDSTWTQPTSWRTPPCPPGSASSCLPCDSSKRVHDTVIQQCQWSKFSCEAWEGMLCKSDKPSSSCVVSIYYHFSCIIINASSRHHIPRVCVSLSQCGMILPPCGHTYLLPWTIFRNFLLVQRYTPSLMAAGYKQLVNYESTMTP